jgi:hypothetical protein
MVTETPERLMSTQALFATSEAIRLIQSGAELDRRSSISVPFASGAQGTIHVSAFFSRDDADKGGVMLRLELDPGDGLPHAPSARPSTGGKALEIHLAGDAEAEAALIGMQAMIQQALIEVRVRRGRA